MNDQVTEEAISLMKFQFESAADFISMSGHGPYVWACYAITAACLAYLVVSPLLKRRSLMAEIKRQSRIAERNTGLQGASR